MDIIENIKRNGVSVKDLSNKTGIPEARIYKWFAGKATPKYNDVQKLEQFLNCLEVVEDKNIKSVNTEENNKEPVNGLTIEAILELARSNTELAKGNTKLASANEEMAIANKTLAIANAGMVKLLERQPVNSSSQDSRIDVVLQPYLKKLSVGLAGKTLSTPDEILQEMGRILVESLAPSKVLGK